MPWVRLKPFITNLFRSKQPFDRRQIAHRAEGQTLHSRRQLLTGLGVVGVCAVAAPSLLLNSANAATVIGSGATNLGGRGQSDWDDAEFEHADLDETELDEAELVETDLDDADLDDAEIIDVSRHRRRRRGRRRSSGRGRRRARGSRRRGRSSRRRRARPRVRRRPRVYARPRRRRRRRSYSPYELRYLCRDYYFRRDFPFLCTGVNWWF